MAYAPIAKLDNFTSKEDDAQIWLNNVKKAIVVNRWNDGRALQAIPYFLKDTADSCINRLTNTFTTIKQGDTKAVTTYLGHFHRNLHQIQTIQADYFTAPQILNQFIRGLCIDLPTTITHARDFKAAKLEANHAQAVNLVMNRSSDLDSKLKQFIDNHAIYQLLQQCNNSENTNHFQNQPCPSTSSSLLLPNQPWQPETCVCHNYGKQDHIRADYSESLPKSKPISNHLPANDAATNLSTTSISTSNLSTAATGNPRLRITQNWRLAIVVHQLILSSSHQPSGSRQQNLGTENAITNNSESNLLQTTLTNNIPPATVTKNKSLVAIFLFELEETINSPLFSGAALKEKLITTIYTDAKVDGHSIKLILDSGLADSIITKQLINQLDCQVDCAVSTRIITADRVTKTPIGEIDDFPIEVNGIIVPIKVLVMEATQYQALIGNDWLSKTNVPAMCGHFKPITTPSIPLIEFEKEKAKPTWEVYQVLWADINHNGLLPILVWNNNDNGKEKQKEKPT
ncbi:hypothetical protein G9A89_017262 [Geosiphon pyriformis]|nr:hypothetical protein G9A89_017262 [Geosiphon pyriformis]